MMFQHKTTRPMKLHETYMKKTKRTTGVNDTLKDNLKEGCLTLATFKTC